jgi:SsrA-binding protein
MSKAKGKGDSAPTIANRRARRDYEILDEIEVGLVLMGSEVKSIRAGRCSIAEGYCSLVSNEVFLIGCRIEPWPGAAQFGHDPDRSRKLLLNKREIERLSKAVHAKGRTIVPLRMYFNDRGLVKLRIGVGRGKSDYDKRQDIKKRDVDRDIARVLRRG